MERNFSSKEESRQFGFEKFLSLAWSVFMSCKALKQGHYQNQAYT
jgi:hypothetical protein